ncbi:UDP-N-acetylmuramoyl-tripeptide--D-alanyl-D-alanine ligase [Ferrimonas sediminicola]|uniref:UDP-N-acetylmuramoyl-tripeptide--D-alanyl-D-alanine ligase n=1 Tax=Ferrimonas sediminicola TaxID=2569538 RepID=A0A4U1BIE7_9GAMM|nr:UDP-N-acetylmuramoyl-tripeptide--D-alanyl-D-alanine ligase [Ferrimonas sediminicola]TKB51266.1 UDP-N-acetylmuramoyl-tripeptide--D-alanyl-D-alanine ligase [Ferrimonas sediminicola]
MIELSLSRMAEILSGELVGEDRLVSSLFTDSRAPQAGGVFVALKGEHFDGHGYVRQVAELAAAALVSEPQPLALPQVVVGDTRLALGQLGAWLCRKLAPYRVAITGSVGKTSVKELTAAIFACEGPTLATRGNFNNDLGVPLTLLRLEPQHRFGVFELGANHPGEIRYTSSLVRPNVAVINNVQAAHLEGFGSIDGVARAKSEIFEHLTDDGVAVINLDDHKADFIRETLGTRPVLTFSSRGFADLYAEALQVLDNGCYRFTLHRHDGARTVSLPLVGRHQVDNALAAAALATAAGIELDRIVQGLQGVAPVKGRMRPIRLAAGVTVIDDCYNASVASGKAAIDALAETSSIKVLIFGDMGELGQDAERLHGEVGAHGVKKEIDHVLTVGTLSRSISAPHPRGRHFADQTALVAAIKVLLAENDRPITLLVKGSRSAAMERVIDALSEHYGEQK